MAQLRGLGLQHVLQPEALVRLLPAANLRAEVSAAHGCTEAFGFDEATRCDVFFINPKKSERLFSPTTRYNDYAISPWEFHWESQSLTRERGGVTLPFVCRALPMT